MVSVLAQSGVNRVFIGGVMVSVLAQSGVDRVFIGGVMVSVLAQSGVDRVFEPQLDQTKDYRNGIVYLSVRHAALKRKSKDCIVPNQDNVSKWGDRCFNEVKL